jgi:ribosome recycling factor
MIRLFLLLLLIGFGFFSCAQVPKQSVELSSTVGRDLATVHKAHRKLAHVLFQRMRQDVNQFIEGVYAPFQIRYAMETDRKLALSQNKDDRKNSLVLAIDAAFQPNASPEQQDKVFKAMGIFVEEIRKDIEAMRRELLDPLDKQEEEVNSSIDRAYQQLHYANSIVTGHLSSIAKVHETQAELLEAIGLEHDLTKNIGESLAKASHDIGSLVEIAEMGEGTVKDVQDNAEKIKEAIKKLTTDLSAKPDGG